jgi:formamidopyrimidine-DNA glycosylase
MFELPEAIVLAGQINQTIKGKRILKATANHSPHKFAWFTGDPAEYNQKLSGKVIGNTSSFGGCIEIEVEDMRLEISMPLTFHPAGTPLPLKHQLLLEFDDSTCMTATVQMWGGLFCFKAGEKSGFLDADFTRKKPSPLSAEFDRACFDGLFDENTPKLSAKAFLATEQRLPGLGNGVLQDILWTAKINPRRKMASLSAAETQAMFEAVKSVLKAMAEQGGRDTERDLFDRPGGYRTVCSKNTVDHPCPACGSTIIKEAYMGGSVYYCPGCQG